MRTTVEIPDEVYKELKSRAAKEGKPMKALILRGVERVLAIPPPQTVPKKKGKLKLPIIESKQPGWLHLTNEMIDDLLFP